jgi:hypothetical protein
MHDALLTDLCRSYSYDLANHTDSGVPIYLQIVQHVIHAIERGTFWRSRIVRAGWTLLNRLVNQDKMSPDHFGMANALAIAGQTRFNSSDIGVQEI